MSIVVVVCFQVGDLKSLVIVSVYKQWHSQIEETLKVDRPGQTVRFHGEQNTLPPSPLFLRLSCVNNSERQEGLLHAHPMHYKLLGIAILAIVESINQLFQ